jgi:hypothetical protein
MRLREFVDRKKQKLNEVAFAAPAAIPAWMWIAGALGIGVGAISQQQIQRMLDDPTGNEYASWKKENPGAIETLPKEVQKQLDQIDREQRAQITQQAEQNRIVAMAQNPDESVTSKINGYEQGQLVIQGKSSFDAQRDANKILATQPAGSVVWILNSDGTYGRYIKTEPKGGVPAWTSSSVAAPGVADTTPPAAPGAQGRDPDDEAGLTWQGKVGTAGVGAAGATTVGPDTDEVDDVDAGPATGAQPETGTDAKPETDSGQSAGTVDKPETGAETEVGSGEITDIGPDVQSDATTKSGDIGADVGSDATTKSGDIGADVGSAAQGADAIPGPGVIAKSDAVPKVIAKPDAAAVATTMPPPMPPPPFPIPMGKKPKPSGSFTYSGTRKGTNDPIRVYGAVDDRGTQKPWGQ